MDQFGVELCHAPFQAVGGEQRGVRPKRRGEDRLGARIDVCVLQRPQGIGMLQNPLFCADPAKAVYVRRHTGCL